MDSNSGASINSDPMGTGCDKHNFYNYGLASVIPSGSTISGITVRADIAVDSVKTAEAPFTAIRLSWDGGTSWTAVKQFTLTATTETTYTYGGSADTWGRTWLTSELSDANFRVRVINGEMKDANSTYDFSLDWLPVSITFTAPWDSYSNSGCTAQEDVFASPNYYVYMKGTDVPNGTYKFTWYDAGGAYVDRETGTSVAAGTLQTPTGLYLGNKTGATVGPGWHAMAQPSAASDPVPNSQVSRESQLLSSGVRCSGFGTCPRPRLQPGATLSPQRNTHQCL
ncbi:MAG: hypothetical protein V1737_04540 [Chloroflexota bacterium]